ncbi:MAG: hypothetical protein K8E24_014390 [Methanobacterium paludis]|nr:hypothetical protein [Methanobacterium paludis]
MSPPFSKTEPTTYDLIKENLELINGKMDIFNGKLETVQKTLNENQVDYAVLKERVGQLDKELDDIKKYDIKELKDRIKELEKCQDDSTKSNFEYFKSYAGWIFGGLVVIVTVILEFVRVH